MKFKADKKTVHITELLSAVAVTATGMFLLIAALGLLPFSIEESWLMAVYVCFFIISLTIALPQKNSIGICFSWIFGLLILAQLFILLGYTHGNIYPIYIVALPMGIANGAAGTAYARKVLICAFAIIGGGLLLLLESMSLLPIKVVLPIIAVYFGILGIICAAMRLYKTKNILHNEEHE